MQFATLAEIVRHQAATQPERIALTFENRDTSYATLDCRANKVANGLITAGLRPASRVALLDKNHDSFFEIWFGAAKANAVLVPVNWRLAGPEIAFIANDAEAEILFVGAEFLAAVAAIRDQLASVREVVVTDRDYPAWRDRQSATDPDLPMVGGDVCIQMYTSGTTGRPKGAQLTNTNLLTELSLLDTMGEWARWQDSDVSLVVMPLFHIAGSGYAMVGFFSGARNVLLREVVAQKILHAIGGYRVTKACFVPAVILFLMQCPGIRDADLSFHRSSLSMAPRRSRRRCCATRSSRSQANSASMCAAAVELILGEPRMSSATSERGSASTAQRSPRRAGSWRRSTVRPCKTGSTSTCTASS